MRNSNYENQVHPTITLELQALERWCNGDPNGFIEISSENVVYHDPFIKDKLIGIEELKRHYKKIEGKIFAQSFLMLGPVLHQFDSVAILTYKLESIIDDNKIMSWICTEVYQQSTEKGWIILHSHWSMINDHN